MTELNGFNEKQIEFASLWWGAKLVGRDVRTQEKQLPEIAARQENFEEQETFTNLLSSISQPAIPEHLVQKFIVELRKSITASIKDGRLEKSRRGGSYLVLEECTGKISDELVAACDAAGISPGHLYQYGHNNALVLHDDGQIYHAGRGHAPSEGHIRYLECPTPTYQVVDPQKIVFSEALYQAVYGEAYVLAVPAGYPVPKNLHGSSYADGLKPYEVRASHFLKDAYLIVQAVDVSPDFTKPEDILDENKVTPGSVYAFNHWYVTEEGEILDTVKDDGGTPHHFPGSHLAETGREGVYEIVTAPFQQLIVPSPIQFGSEYSNSRFEKGDVIIKFTGRQPTRSSEDAPFPITMDMGMDLAIFRGAMPLIRPLSRPDLQNRPPAPS